MSTHELDINGLGIILTSPWPAHGTPSTRSTGNRPQGCRGVRPTNVVDIVTTRDAALQDTSVAEDRLIAHMLTRAIAELFQGRRPISHVARLCDEPTSALVTALCRRGALASTVPGRVHTCRVDDDVLEFSWSLRTDGFVHPAALRAERIGQRWMLTALETVLPPVAAARAA